MNEKQWKSGEKEETWGKIEWILRCVEDQEQGEL